MVDKIKKELITVIVPVYNVENYLSKCLDSLINQTYTNLEIILIDDGSTDASGKICDYYKKKDSRIVVTHQQNKGVSNARNMGLRIAKGEYIGFCDADDWVEKDMYEYLHDLIILSESNIASCGVYNKDFYVSDKVSCFGVDEAIKQIHLRVNMNSLMCTKLFKKDVVQNIYFDETLKICEDYKFQCDAIENSAGVIFGNKGKYHYIQRKTSMCNNGYSLELEKSLKIVKKYVDKYILKYPTFKKQIMSFYILENMGIITSMIKGTDIDDIRLKEIQHLLKQNLLLYMTTLGVPFYLKISAVLIVFNFKIFKLIYEKNKKFI